MIVGFGPIAEALGPAAALLGWQTRTVSDPGRRRAHRGAGRSDKLVVASHDDELAGRPSRRRWTSDVGYIGALGSRAHPASAGRLAGLPRRRPT